jgi:hypothetical protein
MDFEMKSLKNYYSAVNGLLEELLRRSGYDDVLFMKYENKKPIDCKKEEGTDFVAGDGSDDGEQISGYWVGGDIGGILVVHEEWFIKTDLLKEALELKVANLDDIFDWLDYELDLHEKGEELKINFKKWFKKK